MSTNVVTGTVLLRNGYGQPLTVEIAGEIFGPARDQEERRYLLETMRVNARIREASKEHAAAITPLLDSYSALQWAEVERRGLAMLREMGRFLAAERQDDLWRRLYLVLRVWRETADLVSHVILRDDYQQGDEWLFVFGEGWPTYFHSRDDDGEGEEDEADETEEDAHRATDAA